MMRPTALALAAVPLAVTSLTGCSSEPEQPAVPAGVAKQYSVLADELAEKGETVKSGEWTINLITEAAEPWHEVQANGESDYRPPAKGETNHIEIIPVETATGRIVPDVPITLAVVDDAGKVVQSKKLKFYQSTFFHYADNFSISKPGHYTLRATVGVPTFNRHGAKDEKPALAKGAVAVFKHVELGAK